MRAIRTALCLGAVAALVAGCGGSKSGPQIPAQQASDLVSRLQETQRRLDSHACYDLQHDSVPALRQQVQGLPQNLDANVRTTVSDGMSRLEQLINQECGAQQQQTQTTNTTPTTTTTNPSTETTTTAPRTTTTRPLPPPVPTTTTTNTQPSPNPNPNGGVSPGNGRPGRSGGNNGNGNGNGNGGGQ